MELRRVSSVLFTCYYRLVLLLHGFGGQGVVQQLQLTHRLMQQELFNCEISLNAKIFPLLGSS